MKPKTVRETFLMAYGKLQQPGAWIRGAYALDKHRHNVGPYSPSAVHFCSIGAIQNVLGLGAPDRTDMVREVADVVLRGFDRPESRFDPISDVISLNDKHHGKKGAKKVLAAWKKAGQLAGFLDENGCPILEDPKKE